MAQYALPLFCLLINFVALGACIRFLCAKGGQYWILPILLSALLVLRNSMMLYGPSSELMINTASLIDALVSVLWYTIIITFHFALKKVIKATDYQERVRKDLAESRWQLKADGKEQEAHTRKLAIAAVGSSEIFDRHLYPLSWTDFFDQF